MANYYEVSFIKRIIRTLLGDSLNTKGRNVYTYAGNTSFTLSEDYPDSSTIKVYVNGTLLTSGYSYNSSTNIVTITSSLSTDDIIIITYSFYCKYSETEIVNYIEASFAYFSQFGYRKIFLLNSGRDEVWSLNAEFPNLREAYQIAIITAIVIDPKNVSIKTKEFSISAQEDKNQSDLISEAFMKFTNFLGSMSFEEDLQSDI